MPESSEESNGSQPPASKEAARRKISRLAYWSLPFVITFGVLNFFPNVPMPWVIVKVAVETPFTIVYGVAVIRFSLWQRDEYWRERGRDPKHPERFPGDRPSDNSTG
jgi:hypothetical protein